MTRQVSLVPTLRGSDMLLCVDVATSFFFHYLLVHRRQNQNKRIVPILLAIGIEEEGKRVEEGKERVLKKGKREN